MKFHRGSFFFAQIIVLYESTCFCHHDFKVIVLETYMPDIFSPGHLEFM